MLQKRRFYEASIYDITRLIARARTGGGVPAQARGGGRGRGVPSRTRTYPLLVQYALEQHVVR